MPDPKRLTVSATEVPALFGESPYLTRWLLYQKFAHGNEIHCEEDERMREGKRMQPLILERTAQELNLAVEDNGETYVRRGPVGCTRDAIIIHPERGPGALEIKCCFDSRVWMEKWSGGKQVPREIEIQLAVQMLVGDGDDPGFSFSWGIIAVWFNAHQYYFERAPNGELERIIEREAARFLDDVANLREPDPFGAIIELPLITQLFPVHVGKTVDLREVDDADELANKAIKWQSSRLLAGVHGGVADSLRAEFLGLAKDADTLMLPDGIYVRFSEKQRRMSVYVPPAKESAA